MYNSFFLLFEGFAARHIYKKKIIVELLAMLNVNPESYTEDSDVNY